MVILGLRTLYKRSLRNGLKYIDCHADAHVTWLQAFLLFNQSFAQSTREAKAAKKLAKVLASQGAAGSKAQADPSQVVKDLNHAALTIAPTPTGKREESRIKSFLARF